MELPKPFDGQAFLDVVSTKLEEKLSRGKESSSCTMAGTICDDVLSCLPPCDANYVREVERKTRGQTENVLWFKHRQQTVCSSEAGRFLTSGAQNFQLSKLFRDVVFKKPKPFTTTTTTNTPNTFRDQPPSMRAMLQGSVNEGSVFRTIEAFLPELATRLNVPAADSKLVRPGFVRMVDRPHLGASPDILVTDRTDEDDIFAVLEVKCLQRCMVEDVASLPVNPADLLEVKDGWDRLGLKTEPLVRLTGGNVNKSARSTLLKEYGEQSMMTGSQPPFVVTFDVTWFEGSNGFKDARIAGIAGITDLKPGSLVIAPYHKFGIQVCMQREVVSKLSPVGRSLSSFLVMAIFTKTKQADVNMGVFLGDASEPAFKLTRDKFLPLGLIFVPFTPSESYTRDLLTGLDGNFSLGALHTALSELYKRGITGSCDDDGPPMTTNEMLAVLKKQYTDPTPESYIQQGRTRKREHE